MASHSEIEQLRHFLDDNLLLFLSDEHTPTSEHMPTSTFVNSSALQLTEKEKMIFNNAFEELKNHDNNENQQTEVKNDDADDAVNNYHRNVSRRSRGPIYF